MTIVPKKKRLQGDNENIHFHSGNDSLFGIDSPTLSKGKSQTGFNVIIWGPGINKEEGKNADIWIWQMEGTSVVMANSKTLTLMNGDNLLIPTQTKFEWKRSKGSTALYIVQDPKKKRPYA